MNKEYFIVTKTASRAQCRLSMYFAAIFLSREEIINALIQIECNENRGIMEVVFINSFY